MITSSNGNISRVAGILCGDFTGDRCIPRTSLCLFRPQWVKVSSSSYASFLKFSAACSLYTLYVSCIYICVGARWNKCCLCLMWNRVQDCCLGNRIYPQNNCSTSLVIRYITLRISKHLIAIENDQREWYDINWNSLIPITHRSVEYTVGCRYNAVQYYVVTIVYSTVYSGADQRKHQSSASLAFVRGICGYPKGPVMTGEFPAQRAGNAENVFMWLRRHDSTKPHCICLVSWHWANCFTNTLFEKRITILAFFGFDYSYTSGFCQCDWNDRMPVVF